MSSLAIIPARGGSKRIPRKNIKSFLGKPIINYAIEAAQKSGLFDEVMISTDDEEIAEIAQTYGAKIPFKRSIKNSDDFATTINVLLEVIDKYEKSGQFFDSACCIYPTAPFITSSLLISGKFLMEKENYDSVFPVLPFSFPIQRALKVNQNKRIELFQPQYLSTRSQDLESAYHDCGQFYWFNINAIKNKKALWTDNSGVIVLSEMEAHDIDTMEDWKVAEFKYKMREDD